MGERGGGIYLFVCLGQVQGHFLLAYGQDATGNRKRVLREDAGLEVGSYVTLGWVPSLSEPPSLPSAKGARLLGRTVGKNTGALLGTQGELNRGTWALSLKPSGGKGW